MSEFSESNSKDHYDRIAYAIEPEWTEKETPIISSLEYMNEACQNLYELYNQKLLSDNGETELTDDEDEELHTTIDKEIMKISDYFQDIAGHFVAGSTDTRDATLEHAVTSLHTIYATFEQLHVEFLESEDLQYDPQLTDSDSARHALEKLVQKLSAATDRNEALEEIGFYYLDHLYRTFPIVPNYSVE